MYAASGRPLHCRTRRTAPSACRIGENGYGFRIGAQKGRLAQSTVQRPEHGNLFVERFVAVADWAIRTNVLKAAPSKRIEIGFDSCSSIDRRRGIVPCLFKFKPSFAPPETIRVFPAPHDRRKRTRNSLRLP
jgi:hypothetical protein